MAALSFARAAWAGNVLEVSGKAEGVSDVMGLGAIDAARQETQSDRRIRRPIDAALIGSETLIATALL